MATIYECRGVIDDWKLIVDQIRAKGVKTAKRKFRRRYRRVKFVRAIPVSDKEKKHGNAREVGR